MLVLVGTKSISQQPGYRLFLVCSWSVACSGAQLLQPTPEAGQLEGSRAQQVAVQPDELVRSLCTHADMVSVTFAVESCCDAFVCCNHIASLLVLVCAGVTTR